MSSHRLLAAALSVCLLAPAAWQSAAAEPFPPSMVATVTAVKGIVQVRDNEDAPWQIAKPGMTMPIGGEVRTTPRATVSFALPHEQIVTVDRLTTMKLLDAVDTSGGGFHTDLGMKYGRISYDVEAAGLEHEAVIRSPSSALAVRGTNVLISDDAFGSSIMLCSGVASASTPGAGHIELRKDQAAAPDAAESAGAPATQPTTQASYVRLTRLDAFTNLNCVRIDDKSLSLAAYNSSNSTDPLSQESFLSDSESNASRSMPYTFLGQPQYWSYPPTLGFDTVPSVGAGVLSFTLTWFGDGTSAYGVPNLDLSVTSPTGKSYQPSKTGAGTYGNVKVGADDRGGYESTVGTEFVKWTADCPPGAYQYSVNYVGSGEVPAYAVAKKPSRSAKLRTDGNDSDGGVATYTIQVVLNGKTISAPFDDTVTALDPTVSYTIQVPPSSDTTGSLAAGKSKAKSPAKKPAKPPIAPAAKSVARK
jgi:hypothetical protein